MKCPKCKKMVMKHLKTRIMPNGKRYEYCVCNQFEGIPLTLGQMFPQIYDDLEEQDIKKGVK